MCNYNQAQTSAALFSVQSQKKAFEGKMRLQGKQRERDGDLCFLYFVQEGL